jgi:uncharacterized membrane protein YcaP (DUF421 family)
MFNIMIRVAIIYLVVIGIMRLMGKRQIGEMEPFELVITIIIADLAAIPMSEMTIPIWYGVIPLLMIAIIHYIFSWISNKSPFMRDVLNGKPVIIIDPNGIDFKELKKLNISMEELMESIRNLDYFDLSEINYAIIERNGKITIIPKTANMPVTRQDMKLVKTENEIFACIVENGRIIKKNFLDMGLQHEVVMADILHKTKCKPKNIAFASLSEGGDVYLQKRGENCQNLKIKLAEKHYTEKQLAEMRAKGEAV